MSYPEALLAQAAVLTSSGESALSQANARRAISSAYYALFHLLIDEATRIVRPSCVQVPLRRSYEHKTMMNVCDAWCGRRPMSAVARELVIGPIEEPLKRVASVFVDVQQARHHADYDLLRPVTRRSAADHVRRVRKAFDDWRGVSAEPNSDVFLAMLFFEPHLKRYS